MRSVTHAGGRCHLHPHQALLSDVPPASTPSKGIDRNWLLSVLMAILTVVSLSLAYRELRHVTSSAQMGVVTGLLRDDLFICSGLELVPTVQRGWVDRALRVNPLSDAELARLFISAARDGRASDCKAINLRGLRLALDSRAGGGARVNVMGVSLSGQLQQAHISGLQIGRSTWSDLQLDSTVFRDVDLRDSSWSTVSGWGIGFHDVTLRRLRWYGVRLHDCVLRDDTVIDELFVLAGSEMHCDFDAVEIRNSAFEQDLSGSTFRDAVMYEVDFSSADLRNTQFTRATLQSVNFAGADLTGADFSDAKISVGSSFQDATLLDVELQSACILGQGVVPGPAEIAKLPRCAGR